MRIIDEKICGHLNREHKKAEEGINKNIWEFSFLKIGDKVWYRRPENAGDKLDSKWLGPAKVVERIGDLSYVIEVKPGYTMKAHITYLKLYEDMSDWGNQYQCF